MFVVYHIKALAAETNALTSRHSRTDHDVIGSDPVGCLSEMHFFTAAEFDEIDSRM
jgi:hypothetical protein